jgi:S-adenosylmethionine decarboxylase
MVYNFKSWLFQEEQSEVIHTPTGDYCSGLSLNVDLWYDPEQTDFLKVKYKDDLIKTLADAAEHGHMNVFDKRLTLYDNNPDSGFTYLIVLGQSHIVIHTWPEKGLLNIDVFTCGTEGDPNAIIDYLVAKYPPMQKKVGQNQRGIRKHMQHAGEKPDSPKSIIPNEKFKMKSKLKF